MFILHAKSTKLDGTAPCLQYGKVFPFSPYWKYVRGGSWNWSNPLSSGYGSNNVSLVPFFSPLFLAFAHEFGGVVAIPNIRGGSEFGSSWSEAGVKAQKGNTVDDFITATFVSSDQFLYYSWSNTAREYLVTKKYISSSKTAIFGWSAGAELVAQSIARAPSGTFGCAIADRGLYDYLRVSCKSIDVLSSVFTFPIFSVSSVLPWVILDEDHWWPVWSSRFRLCIPVFVSTQCTTRPDSSSHSPCDGWRCVGWRNYPLIFFLISGHLEDVRIADLHGYKFIATCQHNAAHDSGIQLLKVIQGASHETGKSVDIQCVTLEACHFCITDKGLCTGLKRISSNLDLLYSPYNACRNRYGPNVVSHHAYS